MKDKDNYDIFPTCHCLIPNLHWKTKKMCSNFFPISNFLLVFISNDYLEFYNVFKTFPTK